MAESLVIRLAAEPDTASDWIAVDSGGRPVSQLGSGALSDAAQAAEGRKIVALAPASSVLRTVAQIPLKGASKIRQALPFALEEQLAGAVEAQHFACGKKDAQGLVPVAVVNRGALDLWTTALEEAGLRANALYAESDCIAAVPNTVTIVIDLETVIIRDAKGIATVADHDSLEAILELLMGDAGHPTDTEPQREETAVLESPHPDADRPAELPQEPLHIVVYVHEERHAPHAMLFETLRLRVASLNVKLLPQGSLLPRLASEVVNSGGVNLLQGDYAPKTELSVRWQHWRTAVSLLVAVLIVMLMRTGIDYWQLSRSEIALDTAAQQLLSSTFPGADNTPDPWAELRARLGSAEIANPAANAAGFADAVEAVAAAFATSGDIELEALSYRDGKLDVQLLAPNVERLDQLRQGIISSGEFEAEIQSANPDDKGIKGRMKVFAAGGV